MWILLALLACPKVDAQPLPQGLSAGMVVGRPDAPVVITMASDFGCPHCARAWTWLTEGVDSRPGVQLRVRSFPLSSVCNVGGTDPLRCDLAVAGECAAEQGRFRAAADVIFADPTAETLAALPSRAGLDPARFERCLAAGNAKARVAADVAAFPGLQGVPTLWVGRLGGVSELVEDGPEAALHRADELLGEM